MVRILVEQSRIRKDAKSSLEFNPSSSKMYYLLTEFISVKKPVAKAISRERRCIFLVLSRDCLSVRVQFEATVCLPLVSIEEKEWPLWALMLLIGEPLLEK